MYPFSHLAGVLNRVVMKIMLNSTYIEYTMGFFVFKDFTCPETWLPSTNSVFCCYSHCVLGLQLNFVIVSSCALLDILEKDL